MSYAIALGKSLENKETLKAVFKFKFNWDFKVWFKEIDRHAFPLIEKHIESECEGVRVYWAKSLNLSHEIKVTDNDIFGESDKINHKMTGAVIEVKKWYARVFHENNNTEFIFQNMKILSVYRESDKAFQVDVELFGGIAGRCGRCGRRLDNKISMLTGIGPICAEKMGMIKPTLENVEQIKSALKEMAKKQGVISRVWIPKSQIVDINFKE